MWENMIFDFLKLLWCLNWNVIEKETFDNFWNIIIVLLNETWDKIVSIL